MPDDGISSMDDFYFNVLPADWETTIEKSRITVDMPKSFSAENTFLYVGNDAYVAGEPGFTADGNSVTVRLKNFDPANGATVRIVLPEGYFTDELSYGWVNIAAIILPIAAAAIAAVLYVLFGRNKKLFPTVEFYPPEGTTSADVGYMIDGIIDNKDLISLLIYWADKGYIAIETCENNAFTLTRLRGLPMSATEYERTMFDGIFESGTVVPSSKLDDSFYKTLAKTKTQLGDSIKKRGFTAFTTASRVCRILACLLAGAPIGAFLALAGYAAASDITYFGAAAALVMMAVSFVYSITVQAKFGLKKSEYRAKIALCAVVTAAALAGTVIVGAVFDWIVPAAVAAVLTLVIMQLSAVMPTRKKQSREYLEKLLGLREFIRAAELERIEKLSEDDPEYFYHVLPYAYVFGLSDTWAKRFESIAVPPPQWYYGYNNNMFTTMLFMNSLNRSLNSANTVMASSPNSGGSGIGGSGFGGGFSGGGAGGGGGGSW